MATTAYLGLELLDVGQKEKEASINQNSNLIEQKSLRFLGNLASDPSTTNVPKGSTYFNTTTSVLKVLDGANAWVTVGGGGGGGGETGTVTISAAAGADGLVFTNASKIKLRGSGSNTADATYFQSDVTNGVTSVCARGNGTGGSELLAFNSSDLVNNNGIGIWVNSSGSGLINFSNGTGTLKPMYLGMYSGGRQAAITINTDLNADFSGNLKMTGAGKTFTGDFSNATAANRNHIMTSITDGATRLSIVPNGAGTVGTINLENSSSLTNGGLMTIGANATEAFITSGVRGTGTALPIIVYSANSTKAIEVSTTGVVSIPSLPVYLGEAVDDPSPTNRAAGSTYYNTTTSKLKVLLSTGVFVNVA